MQNFYRAVTPVCLNKTFHHSYHLHYHEIWLEWKVVQGSYADQKTHKLIKTPKENGFVDLGIFTKFWSSAFL